MRSAALNPVQRRDGLLSIVLPPEVDIATRTSVLEQSLALLCTRPPVFVVDMTETVFCDSSGLDLLIRLNRRARLLGCELHVVVPHPVVRKVMDIARMHRILAVHDGRESLLRATASGRIPSQRLPARCE